jgi:hypothetical protein
MSTASNLVNAFIKAEKAKEQAVTFDFGAGMIKVNPEMAQMCVEKGIGKIVEPRKSLFGFEPR